MKKAKHWAVFITNESRTTDFIDEILDGKATKYFDGLKGLQGALFSKIALTKLIDEESRHGDSGLTLNRPQSLQSMSSGEQKKALLHHLLKSKPDYIILDNPFDNLDKQYQTVLREELTNIAKDIILIQIISRKEDLLPFITNFIELVGNSIMELPNLKSITSVNHQKLTGDIPPPIKEAEYNHDNLISLKGINVSYNNRPILNNITWKIDRGQFWELSGENGSGKTTILSMITGENPKGYGQELFLFGQKKGSGESIWDIKKNIGYFTPSMTDKFTGYHSLEHMMISGILDSIGLYVLPTEAQLRLAKEWLQLIGMWHLKNTLFHDLTLGQKRLVMTTRAMIKHPLLLILDEPTAGLDDESAALLVSLVNKMANETQTTIIFVSHREEAGLKPQYKFVLKSSDEGSSGKVVIS